MADEYFFSTYIPCLDEEVLEIKHDFPCSSDNKEISMIIEIFS